MRITVDFDELCCCEDFMCMLIVKNLDVNKIFIFFTMHKIIFGGTHLVTRNRPK
jgi:hypothetical protein